MKDQGSRLRLLSPRISSSNGNACSSLGGNEAEEMSRQESRSLLIGLREPLGSVGLASAQ